MGLFDQAGGGTGIDPSLFAILGALGGASQFAGASRLPQTFGQAIGGAGAGALQGIGLGQKYQLGQQELTDAALKNWVAQNQVGQLTGAMGQAPPTRAELLAGTGQIPWLQLFNQQLSGGSGAPQIPGSAIPGAQIPGAGANALPQVPDTSGTMGGAPGNYAAPPPGTGGASFRALAAQKAQLAGIDPDYFTTQIGVESGFNPFATGPKTTGAGEPQQQPKGIAQIKDEYRQWFAQIVVGTVVHPVCAAF